MKKGLLYRSGFNISKGCARPIYKINLSKYFYIELFQAESGGDDGRGRRVPI